MLLETCDKFDDFELLDIKILKIKKRARPG